MSWSLQRAQEMPGEVLGCRRGGRGETFFFVRVGLGGCQEGALSKSPKAMGYVTRTRGAMEFRVKTISHKIIGLSYEARFTTRGCPCSRSSSKKPKFWSCSTKNIVALLPWTQGVNVLVTHSSLCCKKEQVVVLCHYVPVYCGSRPPSQ